MIASPLLLLLGPLVVAAAAFGVRRWGVVAGLVGVVGVFVLGRMVAAVPLEAAGETFAVYGRSLVLTEGVRETMLLVYRGVGLVCLVSAGLPQGRVFVPLTVLLLSPLAGVLMVQPFVFGILLLLVVAALVAMLIQGGRPGSVLAAFRSLAMATMAVCLLLVAGWMMEGDQATFLTSIWQLWLVGLVILLAGFPFHIWVQPVWNESPPLVPAVVFGLVQLVILTFSLGLLESSPWIQQNGQFGVLARGLGGITVGVAALLALFYQGGGFGRLLAYLLLADIGAVVMILPAGGEAGRQLILTVVGLRFVSLVLAGTGLGLVRPYLAADVRKAAARRMPWGVLLYLYGGLSLAGLPLTPGFGGRWAVIQLVAGQSPWLAGLLLLAAAGGVVGLLRVGVATLAAARTEEGEGVAGREALVAEGVAVVVLVAGVVAAVFPGVLLRLLG